MVRNWLDALRYRIATMTYAAGVAHYHRLPMAKSIFQSLFEKLIAKILRREVWGYWYLTSQSGIKVNPSIKELRKPGADPIIVENIMISLHQCVKLTRSTRVICC
jgi:Linalool dehydratase/isomerase